MISFYLLLKIHFWQKVMAFWTFCLRYHFRFFCTMKLVFSPSQFADGENWCISLLHVSHWAPRNEKAKRQVWRGSRDKNSTVSFFSSTFCFARISCFLCQIREMESLQKHLMGISELPKLYCCWWRQSFAITLVTSNMISTFKEAINYSECLHGFQSLVPSILY